MFMFDVETLGKRSNAVILSLAVTHFDPDGKPSPDELRKNTKFIKFDAEDQIKRLKRSVTPSSIDWWKNQCENVKRKSVYPTPIDAVFEQGYEEMRQWAAQYKEPKSWVWARGNLDQLVIDDIEEQLGLNPVFPFSRWRDVRTAIDFLYGTDTGYVKVNYPSFNKDLHITKHNPVDDCILDVMMLLYGSKDDIPT